MKVDWKKKNGKWRADLLLAESGGFERLQLAPGREFSFELSDERRCTGYAPAKGERAPCPEFREIDSGSQCSECRGKDIYSDYVRGDTQNDLDGEFSVYMAQISDRVKVGVTRTGSVKRRWVEQGADYAAEILSGLENRVALENEQDISSRGVVERVRKDSKLPPAEDPELLEQALGEEDFEAEIVEVQKLTEYGELSGKFFRSGLFEGELQAVRGQILSNGKVAIAMTSGKVLKKPEQRGLSQFG
ncbi:MAG: DUF2797 domain-containing protein [Candidatus Nanosalina sp.]